MSKIQFQSVNTLPEFYKVFKIIEKIGNFYPDFGNWYFDKVIPDAVIYSKKLFIHPTRVFNELNSSYWSAWSWKTCTQNAINNLKLKCYNCDYDLDYLKKEVICHIK